MSDVVQQDQENQRFTKEVEGRISMLKYIMADGGKTIDLYSTFVPPELRGRGIAEDLVKAALDYAEARHLQVIASCSFVQKFISRHPERQKLLK